MSVEPRRRDYPIDGAIGLQQNLPLGKIEIERSAIECRTRPDIMRYIGDGDSDDVAAAIVCIWIGRGMDRVVMILSVNRIDGTSDRSRQSSRPERLAGAAASASASVSRLKTW